MRIEVSEEALVHHQLAEVSITNCVDMSTFWSKSRYSPWWQIILIETWVLHNFSFVNFLNRSICERRPMKSNFLLGFRNRNRFSWTSMNNWYEFWWAKSPHVLMRSSKFVKSHLNIDKSVRRLIRANLFQFKFQHQLTNLRVFKKLQKLHCNLCLKSNFDFKSFGLECANIL